MSKTSRIPGSLIIIILIVGFISWLGYQSLQKDAKESGERARDKKEIAEIVKEVIQDNPELILSSLHSLQEKQAAEIEGKMRTSAQNNKEALHDITFSPVLGNKDGDVKVVEFFDYLCGYCKRMGPVTEQLIKDDHNVAVILKILPIMGPLSKDISHVALAAHKLAPQKFPEFHLALMTHDRAFDSVEDVIELAQKHGYDRQSLKEAMRSKEIASELSANEELARKLELQGTPIFYIGDEVIPGATDLNTFKAVISKVRGDAK